MQVNTSHSNTDRLSDKGTNYGLAFVLLFFLALPCRAQQLLPLDSTAQGILKRSEISLSSPEARFAYLQKAHQQGYLLARLIAMPDSLRWGLRAGKQFFWLSLQAGNVPTAFLRAGNIHEHRFAGRPFRYVQVLRLQERILQEAINSGYPFAQIGLDSLAIQDELLEARLVFTAGPYLVFDSLALNKESPVKAAFLKNKLGIAAGLPYSERKVLQIEQRLHTLPYLRLAELPAVHFKNQAAQLNLNLQKRPASQLDLLLALQNKPEGAGVLLTGQFDLDLQNPFGGGKSLAINWKRLNTDAQQLQLQYQHPYPFGFPLVPEVHFKLQKEKQLFLNRQLGTRLGFEAPSADQYRLLFERRVSDLLGEAAGDTLADSRISLFGLGFERNRLNNISMPSRGYSILLEAMAGNKQFRLPETAAADKFQESGQYHFQGRGMYAAPLANRLVWVHRLQQETLLSDFLFTNELLRLGGLNSLRGFREQFFFVRHYVLSRAEVQFRWSEQSHLFLFYDQAWIQPPKAGIYGNDYPWGIGAGLRLQANNGLFQLIYGLGMSGKAPDFPQNSQVHFGYVSKF